MMVAPSPAASTRVKRRLASKKFRQDIQVLRAFAVVVVILEHLFGWPSGGFVGVDVFFVISGFLITGHLLSEGQRTRSISITKFYRKRMRRLLPAAMATLVATLVLSYVLFNTTRWLSTAWDTLYAAVFLANWRFAAVGSDYFQADGPISPLRHFWSLSVEEQFYVAWPLILIGAFAVSGRRGKRASEPSTLLALPFIIVIVVSSIGWAIYETVSSPTVAYFSTFSRAWELGVGALLAVVAPRLASLDVATRTILVWLGIAAMFASLFVVSSASAFPFPWALLPVLGAAAFLAAGTGGEPRWTSPLNNAAVVYVGNISYSLYLWHFPVIIFYQSYFGLSSLRDYAICLLWIGVLSAGSYHLIEKPVLDSEWLLKSDLNSRRGGLVSRLRKDGVQLKRRTAEVVTVFAVGVVVAVSLTVIQNEDRTMRNLQVLADVSAPRSVGSAVEVEQVNAPPLGPAGQKVRADIDAALVMAAWPDDLSPSIDDALANDTYPPGLVGCGNPVQPGDCIFGDRSAPNNALILGDSVAMKFAGGLLDTFATGDWNLQVQALFGCSFVDINPKKDAEFEAACAERKQRMITQINEARPELVLIVNTAVMMTDADTGQKITPKQWGAGMQSILGSIAASGSKIVVMSPPPPDADVKECYSPASSPARCVSRVTPEFSTYAKYAAEAVGAVPGTTYLDSRYLFCSESGACPAFAGGMATKRDRTHPTTEYVKETQPAMVEMLTAVGAL